MSRSLRSRSRLQLGLAATFVAMLPGTALAADAPLRYVGIDPSGTRTSQIHWVAASEDAHELIGTQITGEYGYGVDGSTIVDRDVVAGTTTAISAPNTSLVATSTDLRKLLIRTKQSLSPKDTNTLEDYYVLNRDTNAYTLVSVDASGNAIGNDVDAYGAGISWWNLLSPGLSGDGNTVQFYKYRASVDADGAYTTDSAETDRVNVATGAVTKLPEVPDGAYTTQMDDAGRVAVSTAGISVDGVKKVDVPSRNVWTPVISPDGGWAAAWDYELHGVREWNLKTGAQVASYAIPSYAGGRETPTIRYVANGGTAVVLSDLIKTNDGTRLAFGRVDGSGNFSQVGGDIKVSDWEYLDANSTDARVGNLGLITRNQQFAVTGMAIAQLGTTPLPGVEPTVPSTVQVSDYLYIYDSTCHFGGFWNLFHIYTNPTVTLAVTPQRSDLRRPVSFTGTVSKTAAAKQIASGTINPGKPTEISGVGINGGWQIDGTLTFNDGSKLTGTKTVATHGNPICSTFPAG